MIIDHKIPIHGITGSKYELIEGMNGHFIIRDTRINGEAPYVISRDGMFYICIGYFVRASDKEKWISGEDVEVLT